jgi:hypothetical protein
MMKTLKKKLKISKAHSKLNMNNVMIVVQKETSIKILALTPQCPLALRMGNSEDIRTIMKSVQITRIDHLANTMLPNDK